MTASGSVLSDQKTTDSALSAYISIMKHNVLILKIVDRGQLSCETHAYHAPVHRNASRGQDGCDAQCARAPARAYSERRVSALRFTPGIRYKGSGDV